MKMIMKQLIYAVSFGVFLLTASVLSTPLEKRSKVEWKSEPFKCDYDEEKLEGIVKWTITDSLSCEYDGCGERPVILVHRTGDCPNCNNFPAPTICAKPKQHIRIEVTNNLTKSKEATTIHWHGFLMKIEENTPFSDGVPAKTQCPIQYGEKFVYNFWASDEPGTHWYHSHYKPQRMDGLYGLNVNNIPPEDQALSATFEPVPHSVLINGKGQGVCKGKVEVTCTDAKDFHDLSEECATYRLRITNAGALIEYYFYIDGHKLQVIEVEGQKVNHEESKWVNRVPIHIWQRQTPNVRYNTPFTMFTDQNKDEPVTVGEAYAGASSSQSSSWNYSSNILILDERGDTIEVTLASADRISPSLPFGFRINIERAKCTYADMHDVREFCKKHGHFFEVIQTLEYLKDPIKYANPISRDTVTVPPKGTAIIRFKVDNPGVWAFHCHIEWHVEVGMMAQFVELPNEILGLKFPEEKKDWDNLCKNTATTAAS
ncbi:11992_t:CDS:10, partial [Gigaspora margarita]